MTAPRAAVAALPLLALMLLGPRPAGATDPQDLDLFLPTTLEDAFAGEPDGAEAQFSARFDRRRGRDALLLLPTLQLSPLSGLQLNASLPYRLGTARDAGQGEFSLGALYNLNRETRWLPAFALAVDASAPVGPGDRATELQLTGVASRSLDRDGHHRLHLNAAWSRRFAPSEDERRHGHRLAVGYSTLVDPDTVLILDAVRERQERGERPSNVVEAGARLRLLPGLTVGLGAGAGIGRDSPRLRLLFSVEIDL